MTTFTRGDRVAVDPNYPGVPRTVTGRVWIVDRVNPVNIVCRPEDGIGRGINYPKASLIALGAGDPPPAAPAVTTIARSLDTFVVGEIVTSTYGPVAGQPLVVLRDNGERLSAAPLGGDKDRYVRLSKTSVTRRDIAWLTQHLADQASTEVGAPCPTCGVEIDPDRSV